MERDSFLSSHSFLIFFSYLCTLGFLSQLKKQNKTNQNTSTGNTTQTLVCSLNLVLFWFVPLPMASAASGMATALPTCLQPPPRARSPHPSFADAVPVIANATAILNFLLLKSNTMPWFLQKGGFFRPAQMHLFLQAFSEASVPYLETLYLYFS